MVTQIVTKKTIPFPRELPLLGSLPAYTKDRLALFLQLSQTYQDVCGLHFGPFPILQFNKPEHVHSIFVEHAYDFDKGAAMHEAVAGNGIFISEGNFHRHQRKLMAPSFQPRQIVNYAETMTHYGELIQQQWSDTTVIDLNQQMNSLTMSIIGKVLFDADVFTETDTLGKAVSILLGYTTYRLSTIFAPPRNWPTPRNRRVIAATNLLFSRIQRMIKERRASKIEKTDFLSILLRAQDEDGKTMSDIQVMDECLTLFAAGHETTSTTLVWTWYLLCKHPEIYQQVQAEVDTALQGRTPTYADLAHLPYCLQVIKETMRLYPPAYAISRAALHDIEIDGYPVKKGQGVFVVPYAMHRNPQLFPEPEKFDPTRFTPEREKQLPRYAYLPFGAGPRICIGNHFALMEAHLLLATIAQHTTFSLQPEQTIKTALGKTLTLRPYGKVEVTVKKR